MRKPKREFETKVEKDEPGWWNDQFRRVNYVQNAAGQWHAESVTWPPSVS